MGVTIINDGEDKLAQFLQQSLQNLENLKKQFRHLGPADERCLRCGDLIAVDYEARRAHYRIVWIVDAGTRDGARIAIHRVGTRPCPWEELLPAETVVQ